MKEQKTWCLFPVYFCPVLSLHHALSATATTENCSKNKFIFIWCLSL